MRPVAFDTETYWMNSRGKATLKAVGRLVCMTVHDGDANPIYDRGAAVLAFKTLLDQDDVQLVGHNVAFDLLVMLRACTEEGLDGDAIGRRIFDLVSEGRVSDTMYREKLIDISKGGSFRNGGYDLARIAKTRLGVQLAGKKGDVWRYRYNELDGVPLQYWPEEATRYAKYDAVVTYEIYMSQGGVDAVLNEDWQVASSWCLKLMGAWGIRVDQQLAQAIDAYYATSREEHRLVLEAHELFSEKGSLKRSAVQGLVETLSFWLGRKPVLTEKGATKTDKATLNMLAEEWEEVGEDVIESGMVSAEAYQRVAVPLEALIAYNRATKFRSTYLEPLLDAGDDPLSVNYNALVDSGRTSAGGPNIQNFPAHPPAAVRNALRDFRALHPDVSGVDRVLHHGLISPADIRSCFKAREGYVYLSADYAAIEMAGLAQIYINTFQRESALANSINAGEDQHIRLLADWKQEPYAELLALKDTPEIDHQRFLCKSANYGFGGLASAETWCKFIKAGGNTPPPLHEAQAIREAWLETWDMQAYFDYVAGLETAYGYYVNQHGPNRMTSGWRVRLTDTIMSAANSLFQGIVADGAKAAMWELAEACYLDTASPLYNARPMIFCHDEFVLEVPADKADDAAKAELTRIMCEGMQLFLPDLVVRADAKYATRWSK
jgi:DNA polymerase-1